ncbi:hypothetical protein HU200_022985 [Digitaria exilis]|uniref:Disease resistance protein winged helix domain-containing protein n=1 Tax=Digitaria exilis TaxID=1010633 RepID=A0A835CDE2_9POAL|nr:hypothetical protein HU200_022985 [Digitaria exilis]
MESALGAANWLLGKVLSKLSDELVAGYVASRELGLNFDKIKDELNYTLGILHAAQGRGISDNPGLQGLLEGLAKKADEAEDALDELHYFMIQDELYDTREATPELGDGLSAQAQHAHHAARSTAGNWLSCFSCCNSQDYAAVTENTSKAKSPSDTRDGHADKLPFDRVAMSNKIKQLIGDMQSKCSRVSDLLNKSNDEWEKLLAPLIKGDTTSNMLLVTTRFPKVVEMVTKATDPIALYGLDPDDFWKFFQKCVFGEIQHENDKEDLIDIGRQIAKDYKFDCSEISRFWISIGIIDSSDHEVKIEDMGSKYLDELLDNGFLMKGGLSRLDISASDGDHEEVVLNFPPSSSLRHVRFNGCKNLILPVEDGSGFQGLLLLESIDLAKCGRLFSRWSTREASQSINPFPCCLKELYFWNESSTMSMALLSNLTSLTTLRLEGCTNLTVDGFNPLTISNITDICVYNLTRDETEPYSTATDLLAEVARTKAMPAGSIQLVRLVVDSISAVLVAPICSLLSATLRFLSFSLDCRVDGFTEEQEQALQLLASLEFLCFDGCRVLQYLPQGLHRLSSLEGILIAGSPKIRSLPKKGLPDSLETLRIINCCAELYEECQKLKATRPDIDVYAKV